MILLLSFFDSFYVRYTQAVYRMGATNNKPQTGTNNSYSSGSVSLRDKQLTE